MLSINTNLMAANTANNLNSHYSRLSTSTQRLSSGLRINSAADDAAGLAIRELMRAQVSALQQGMRNVNDAISMIQTFDGALSVIDEKLIRMKELAEQAATGTYNSTQRLMIDSEFQAMGSEIDRIARATDFNGIKLIDGKDAAGGAIANHSAGIAAHTEITSPDGTKKFEVNATGTMANAQFGSAVTSQDWDLSGITNPDALPANSSYSISNSGAIKFGNNYLLVTPDGFPSVPADTQLDITYDPGANSWEIKGTDSAGVTTPATVASNSSNNCLFNWNGSNYLLNVYDPAANNGAGGAGNITGTTPVSTTWKAPADDIQFVCSSGNNVTGAWDQNGDLIITLDLGNSNSVSKKFSITGGNGLAITELTLDLDVRDVTPPQVPNPPNPPTPPGPTGPSSGQSPES